jgi:Zn-dependent oligopeptidase
MKHTNYTQKDFSWCKMSVEEINKFPKIAAESIKARIKIIQDIKKENRNFENTIYAFENANDQEMIVMHKISTLSMVSDKKEIRDAARLAEVEISNLSTDIAYDIKTFNAISDYYDHNYIFKKKESILDDQDIKLVEDIMRGYKRMGFDLPLKVYRKEDLKTNFKV